MNTYSQFQVIVISLVLTLCQTAATAEELSIIENDVARVGIDLEKGAAITWLSWKDYPQNMVNIADPGRLIQQSYYAGKSLDRTDDGQHKAWSPWAWNPIQGGGVGSWARVTAHEKQNDRLYAETIPKLWDMPNEEAAARMRQWTSFEPDMPDVIVVKCELVCNRAEGDRWGPAVMRSQEVPACYFTRNFSTAKSYLGEGKWRGESQPPGPPWGHANPPLNAMAVFEAGGQGVAIFSPVSTFHWNFGPHGGGLSENPTAGPCMHVAPITRVVLGPKSRYQYRYWLVVGDSRSLAQRLDQLIQKYGDETPDFAPSTDR